MITSPVTMIHEPIVETTFQFQIVEDNHNSGVAYPHKPKINIGK
jgi:hypothetical protein